MASHTEGQHVQRYWRMKYAGCLSAVSARARSRNDWKSEERLFGEFFKPKPSGQTTRLMRLPDIRLVLERKRNDELCCRQVLACGLGTGLDR